MLLGLHLSLSQFENLIRYFLLQLLSQIIIRNSQLNLFPLYLCLTPRFGQRVFFFLFYYYFGSLYFPLRFYLYYFFRKFDYYLHRQGKLLLILHREVHITPWLGLVKCFVLFPAVERHFEPITCVDIFMWHLQHFLVIEGRRVSIFWWEEHIYSQFFFLPTTPDHSPLPLIHKVYL